MAVNWGTLMQGFGVDGTIKGMVDFYSKMGQDPTLVQKVNRQVQQQEREGALNKIGSLLKQPGFWDLLTNVGTAISPAGSVGARLGPVVSGTIQSREFGRALAAPEQTTTPWWSSLDPSAQRALEVTKQEAIEQPHRIKAMEQQESMWPGQKKLQDLSIQQAEREAVEAPSRMTLLQKQLAHYDQLIEVNNVQLAGIKDENSPEALQLKAEGRRLTNNRMKVQDTLEGYGAPLPGTYYDTTGGAPILKPVPTAPGIPKVAPHTVGNKQWDPTTETWRDIELRQKASDTEVNNAVSAILVNNYLGGKTPLDRVEDELLGPRTVPIKDPTRILGLIPDGALREEAAKDIMLANELKYTDVPLQMVQNKDFRRVMLKVLVLPEYLSQSPNDRAASLKATYDDYMNRLLKRPTAGSFKLE